MADDKKYFWLKLPTDFFKDRSMKKLKRMAAGPTYLVIYQKLLLLSLENGGNIYFEGIEDSFEDEMSLELDENVEDIQMTMLFLMKYNLIEQKSENHYFMSQVPEMIGSETDSARRKRKSRNKLNGENVTLSQPNENLSQGVTNCPAIIEKEKEEDIEKEKEEDIEKDSEKPEKPKTKPKKEKPLKHNHAEFVLLSVDEHQKLIDEHGEQGTLRIIEILNNYKGASGKTYKSDYLAILNWVVERYKKENPNNQNNQGNTKKDSTMSILKRMHQRAKEKESGIID